MDDSLKKGLSFGMTSATITTLGLMVGLDSATGSRLAVIGGILTIAIADAFSDALGIHISEEAENKHTHKQIWNATVATFFSKLVFALTFVIPVFVFSEVHDAVYAGVAWGMIALTALSYIIAKQEKADPKMVIFEHLTIAVVVLLLSGWVGTLIHQAFA